LDFGLIAEEVAEVNPHLVARNSHGEAENVHYEMVNAMSLNEFFKARRQIDAQQKQIDALTAGLQKVSAQLEASKFAMGESAVADLRRK
jgi:very-short-patch-repair endonuclease